MSLFKWLFGPRPTRESQPERVRFPPLNLTSHEPPIRSAPPPARTSDDWDDDRDDEDAVGGWGNLRFKDLRERRPSGMVILDGFAGLSVAGTQHRLRDALNVIQAAQSAVRTNGTPPVLQLEREPGNAVDRNAVGVIAALNGGRRIQIGYLPAANAKLLAAQFLPDMPIMAELREFGWKTDGTAVSICINVLGPKAADRKKFLRT